MRFRKDRTCAPVRPSAAIRTTYDQRLTDAVDKMSASVIYWVSAAYKRESPVTVDASAAEMLRKAVAKLSRQWLRNFDELAGSLAAWFATSVEKRSTTALTDSLRKGGFTVRFRPSAAVNEALQAVIGENVALIKSIPEQYLKSVEGAVMRSVQTGRDLATLTDELTKTYSVTKRRAKLIALSQNNQATAVIVRTRQLEAGLTRARWLHSAGGRVPRPEHVAFSGKTYDIATGADVEGKWPGVAINCRCVSQPVIPGWDD